MSPDRMPVTHQNIPLVYIVSLLNKGNKLLYFLTYLKLRTKVRHEYGAFRVSDDLSIFLGLRMRTVRKHIEYGLEQGWFRVDPLNSAQYQIVSIYKFGRSTESRRETIVSLDDKFLLSISHRNIATLKAYIQEVANERFKRYKAYTKSKEQTKGIWSQRDKCYIKPQSKRKSRNGTYKGEPVTYFACSLAAALTHMSPSTTCRYCKLAPACITYRNTQPIWVVNAPFCAHDLALEWNSDKQEAIKHLLKPNAFGEYNETHANTIRYGHFVVWKSGVYLHPAAQRIGSVPIRRLKVKRGIACKEGEVQGGLV